MWGIYSIGANLAGKANLYERYSAFVLLQDHIEYRRQQRAVW